MSPAPRAAPRWGPEADLEVSLDMDGGSAWGSHEAVGAFSHGPMAERRDFSLSVVSLCERVCARPVCPTIYEISAEN